jgi:LacI family transcriptional regulator
MQHIQTLLSMRVDGLLVSITEQTLDTAIFEVVKKRKVPMVFFDRAPDVQGFTQVISDDEGGSYQAVSRMIESGYTKIAHLSGYSHTNIGRARQNGFRRAMKDKGISYPEEYLIEGGFGEADGFKGFMRLFKSGNMPQAIFAVTYPVALGVLTAANEVGMHIPGDLDLVCFGGSELNRFIKPSLSFVDQPAEQIGKIATQLLLDEINDTDIKGRHIAVPTSLVLCDTCITCSENY